jgi:hypothetical protein
MAAGVTESALGMSDMVGVLEAWEQAVIGDQRIRQHDSTL